MAHLHIDCAEDYAKIEREIAAAVAWMEGPRGILGRCILTQTWAIQVPALQDMDLPFPDVQSAVVTYLDQGGTVQTVDPEDYRVRTRRGVGRLIFAPDFVVPEVLAGRDDAVTVSAVYGWEEAPAPLRTAVVALVGHRLRHPEGAPEEVPASVLGMVRNFRVGLMP